MNDRINIGKITRRRALVTGVAAVMSPETIRPFGPNVEQRSGKSGAVCSDQGKEFQDDFPFLIIRLHPRHHRDKAALAEMLDLLKSRPGVCEEVWFCTEFGFPSLRQHRESAGLMVEAAEKIRKLGIAPGLQIANTIGHGGSGPDAIMAAGRQRLTGPDGTVAGSCNCPRDRDFLDYQRQLADIYAAAIQPSSLWIDDDLRMNAHPPVQYACFCDHCLAEFSQSQARTWTRETLVTELVRPEQYSRLRLDWVAFGIAGLAHVAGVISSAAVKRAPACRIGLQQCSLDWTSYYGPDLNPIFSAMAKASGRKPGSRLGHGYYTDHAPRGVLNKSFGIARQVERAGGALSQICPEVENHLHTSMGKSPRGTAIESTLHLAMGCNSLSFALWNDFHLEGPEWMALFLEKFEVWLPLWRRMVAYNRESSLGGLDLAFGRRHAARPIGKTEKPWSFWSVNFDSAMQLSTTGLPLCPDSPLACASLLTAEAASGLTKEELRRLFSGGVLLDGEAVARLQDRHLGFDLGIRADYVGNSGASEFLTRDPINDGYGETRWVQNDGSFHRLSFHGVEYRCLGEMRAGQQVLGCATAVFENRLGGRTGVLGFNGLQNVISTAKRMQLLRMADWISRGRLPAILETSAQVVVCPRLDQRSGAMKCLTLLNASIGEPQPLALRLRHCRSGEVILYSAEGTRETPLSTRREGTDLLVKVPSLSPWGIVFLALDSLQPNSLARNPYSGTRNG